jgi:pimeloyl-ACP methyl ester carboxylesterase
LTAIPDEQGQQGEGVHQLPSPPEVWLGRLDRDGSPDVVVVRGGPGSGLESATVDDPARLRFRQPADVAVRGDEVMLRLPGGSRVMLTRAADIEPGTFDGWSGWYEAQGRLLLFTQVPEADLGEPMVLLAEADTVLRLYPRTTRDLLADDGSTVELVEGPDGSRVLRYTRSAQLSELPRSDRFVEREVNFVAAGAALAGTLIRPATLGPHPAAVLVHGAAGGQRDFSRLFAERFLGAGVATLIYDKSGHGLSGGSPDPSIFDQAEAASAAIDVLRTEPDIDAGRIGLAGFSNGMWAVPMVAARRSDVSFVCGIASAGVSMAESEVHRRTTVLRDQGFSQATVDLVAQAWRGIFAVLAAGDAPPEAAARLEPILQQVAVNDELATFQAPDYVKQNPMLSPVPPVMHAADLAAMTHGRPSPELAHDPAADYRAIGCPVLLQYGGADSGVPAATSAARIAQALAQAGNGQVTIKTYPGLDHLLNIPAAVTGLSTEEAMFQFRGFRFGAPVWPDLHAWLAEHIAG